MAEALRDPPGGQLALAETRIFLTSGLLASASAAGSRVIGPSSRISADTPARAIDTVRCRPFRLASSTRSDRNDNSCFLLLCTAPYFRFLLRIASREEPSQTPLMRDKTISPLNVQMNQDFTRDFFFSRVTSAAMFFFAGAMDGNILFEKGKTKTKTRKIA